MSGARVRVQVVYAMPRQVWLRDVELAEGACVRDAIVASGLKHDVEGIEIDESRIGIFSRPANFDTVLREGDRVELYRPLLCDPKDVRRRRAAEAGR